MEVVKRGDFVEVIGHCENEIQCAKMTLLADLYAVEHREGYAKFRADDADKLKYITDAMEFVLFWNVDAVDNYGNDLGFRPLEYVGGLKVPLARNVMDGSLITIELTSSSLITVNGSQHEGGILNTYEPFNDFYQIQLPDGTTYNIGDTFSFKITSNQTWTIIRKEKTTAPLDVTYNGTKIIDGLEVTPPVDVTYNGSTITTLNAGDTKTIQCNGKVMASNIGIGDKTLQCSGKLMASDVVIEVGGVTPTGETWVINEEWEIVKMPIGENSNFTSNNTNFGRFYVGSKIMYDTLDVCDSIFYQWLDQAYRTVTFETPPTGNLLTWLQDNAVKQ